MFSVTDLIYPRYQRLIHEAVKGKQRPPGAWLSIEDDFDGLRVCLGDKSELIKRADMERLFMADDYDGLDRLVMEALNKVIA